MTCDACVPVFAGSQARSSLDLQQAEDPSAAGLGGAIRREGDKGRPSDWQV